MGCGLGHRSNLGTTCPKYVWGFHGFIPLQVPENLPTENPPKNTEQKHKSLRCEIAWSFFSRKPPALTSISRRKSAIHPAIASINVCQRYPPCCALWGFPMGYDNPLPLFCAFPPWRACEVEVRYPPPTKGVSLQYLRYPMKTRQKRAIPPSAILSREGIARNGGVSRTGPLRGDILKEDI